MKRILFLVATLDPGGLEHYLLRFLEYAKDKFEPVVICKNGVKGELSSRYEELGVEVITLKMGYVNPLAWWKLRKFLKERNIESICDFTGNFSGLSLMVGYFSKIKKRVVFYRLASNHFPLTTFRLVYNKIVHNLTNIFATKILFNSQTGLDFFFPKRRQADKRFVVISNGIDSDKFVSSSSKSSVRSKLGIPWDAFVVGHTGRLNVAKNHSTILGIAERLTEKYNDIYFVLCGKDTEKLFELSMSSALKSRILILGYRRDVNEILKAFDVFLFPSITEGQPNSLIEAMVTGIPILASNIESIQEVIPHEYINELCDPMDISAFSLKIEKLYENRNDLNGLLFKEYAINKFDATSQFDLFYSKI